MGRTLVLTLTLLFSCASWADSATVLSYKEFLKANAESIGKVQLGMTKEQVVTAMGTISAKVPDGVLANPWKTDAFVREGQSYEVLHYLVRPHPPFTAILENQAQQVVLKDGVVVGLGRSAVAALQ